jgi:hypothetical protein
MSFTTHFGRPLNKSDVGKRFRRLLSALEDFMQWEFWTF